jgi:signal peptidase
MIGAPGSVVLRTTGAVAVLLEGVMSLRRFSTAADVVPRPQTPGRRGGITDLTPLGSVDRGPQAPGRRGGITDLTSLQSVDRRAGGDSGQGVVHWLWLAALVWPVGIYLVVNFFPADALSASVRLYVLQPLLWSSLALLSFLGWRYGLEERPPLSKAVVAVSILTGLFQVALFLLAGLVLGFGASPYGHRPLTILRNLVHVGTMLVGIEMSRAYLLAFIGRDRPVLVLALVTTFFTLLSTPVAAFRAIAEPADTFQLVGETLLPTASENLLASYVALLGGPIAAIGYRGTLQAFEWLSPILPDLPWLVAAFLGTMAPALGLPIIESQFSSEPVARREAQPRKARSASRWLLVLAVVVAALWFNAGLLGFRPILVAGVSMEPTLKTGDVAVTRDVSADDVRVGDIIRFRKENSHVLHRVVQITSERGAVQFVTQGDANNTLDEPVQGERLEGKVVLVVPKIGWVTLGMWKLIGRAQ